MEIVFWSLAALMSAAAVAAVVWPLWRGRRDAGASRRNANITIYRERVGELRADVDSGRLPAQEANALEEELGRRLLAETDEARDTTSPDSAPRRPWRLTLALALLLPALGGGLYWLGGNWQLVGDQPPPLHYLLAQLEARVARAPTDLHAWHMLGQVRGELGRFAEAARAYAQVNVLLPDPNAEALVEEALARAAAQKSFAGRPTELFQAALTVDPDQGMALWFAGLAADQAGDFEQARGYWQRLASKQDLPTAMRAVLDERLARLPGGQAPTPAKQ